MAKAMKASAKSASAVKATAKSAKAMKATAKSASAMKASAHKAKAMKASVKVNAKRADEDKMFDAACAKAKQSPPPPDKKGRMMKSGAAQAMEDVLSTTGSLNEKLAHLKKCETLTLQQKLDLMNKSFSLEEWNKLNGRAATLSQKDDEVASQRSEAKTNGEKRHLTALLALDPSGSLVMEHRRQTIRSNEEMNKQEVWVSTKQVLKKWSKEELEDLLACGRMVERELQPGVMEYMDTQNYVYSKSLQRQKEKQKTQESEYQGEDEDWSFSFNKGMLSDRSLFSGGQQQSKDADAEAEQDKKGKKGKKGKLALEDDPVKKITSAKQQITGMMRQLAEMNMKTESPKMKKTCKVRNAQMEQLMQKLQSVNKDNLTQEAASKLQDEVSKAVAACKAEILTK